MRGLGILVLLAVVASGLIVSATRKGRPRHGLGLDELASLHATTEPVYCNNCGRLDACNRVFCATCGHVLSRSRTRRQWRRTGVEITARADQRIPPRR